MEKDQRLPEYVRHTCWFWRAGCAWASRCTHRCTSGGLSRTCYQWRRRNTLSLSHRLESSWIVLPTVLVSSGPSVSTVSPSSVAESIIVLVKVLGKTSRGTYFCQLYGCQCSVVCCLKTNYHLDCFVCIVTSTHFPRTLRTRMKKCDSLFLHRGLLQKPAPTCCARLSTSEIVTVADRRIRTCRSGCAGCAWASSCTHRCTSGGSSRTCCQWRRRNTLSLSHRLESSWIVLPTVLVSSGPSVSTVSPSSVATSTDMTVSKEKSRATYFCQLCDYQCIAVYHLKNNPRPEYLHSLTVSAHLF